MSVIGNALLLGGDAGAPSYTIDRSVRLRSSASASFTRTPATSGNRQIFTISFWLKRGTLGGADIFDGNNANGFIGSFRSDYTLYLYDIGAASGGFQIYSARVFRDPSAWYHIVIAVDTTQATDTNRIKVYINGVQENLATWTLGAGASRYPSLNANFDWNNTNQHKIGYAPSGNGYFDGYITEFNNVSGYQLDASYFGSINSTTGVWQPIKYSGTYGTNGFYLNFNDNSAATAAAIGKDSSGNGNNWTPNNISVTAGVTYDSMLDVPTLTSATNANYAVGNPLNADGSTWSGGNLNFSLPNSTNNAQGTVSVTSGKWYWEVVYSANTQSTGVQEIGLRTRWTSGVVYAPDGTKYINGTNSAYGASFTTGDIIGVALDMDASTVTFYKNNASQGSISLSGSGCVNATFTTSAGGGSTSTGSVNFGQRPFSYTPPSGFKSLNTYNLPDPTIASGDDYHKVYTYTGNGGGLQVGEIQKPLSLYNLDRSLRFKGTNSYFDKVFASGGANTKGTLSMWVKRGKLAVQQELVRFGTTGTLFSGLYFSATDTLNFVRLNSTYQTALYTTKTFRDPLNWIHIVVAWDTTLATASDRVKIYVNGIQETVFSSATYPTQNLDMYFFTAGTHNIGRYPVGGNYFGGYMAEFHAVDGTQLTANDFGQFDGNYYWTPKDYTGGYGTNGWHLDFEDFSSMSATGIGKDVSGNGNNFTPYNFNVTTPADTNVNWDSMVDVPTQTSADVANFATWSPFNTGQSSTTTSTLSNGNLLATGGAINTTWSAVSTIVLPTTGKWYFEAEMSATSYGNGIFGIFALGSSTINAYAQLGVGTRVNDNVLYTYTSYNTASPNRIGIAYDADNGLLWQTDINGNWLNSKVPAVDTTGLVSGITKRNDYVIGWRYNSGAETNRTCSLNCGQKPFFYTPPTGFKSLNSFNVAEVTGDLESPDFVWIKSRSAATGHALFNSVTGVGKYLSSNATTAETTDVNSLIQFNKNGFLLGNAAIVNTSAATYVASAWKGGGAAVTNTAGSITSQVSANQKAGFSIVTYTGTGANATVGHGLGIAPKMLIVKGRSIGNAWGVWQTALAGTEYLILNTTAAKATAATLWNSTTPTSSVFSLGTDATVNGSTSTYVAYCFSEIAGFSKFGSYTGNGSTDGTFVYLGFRPRFIMIKHYIGGIGQSWSLHDTTRNTYNPHTMRTQAESTNAENTNASNNIDVLSNGFKIRTADNEYNNASYSYIYAAFAENPFKYSLAR